MKALRQLRRVTDFVVACFWTIPVLIFVGYILWSLVPFVQDDSSSQIASVMRTAAYFCMRAVTGIWAGEWSFLPVRFDDLGFGDWGIFYCYGLIWDLSFASLVLQLGLVITLYLNRCAFAMAVRIRRSGMGR
ncbi:hypothetical protein WJ07_12260 [Burkholderia vietnamiensis]|uniref:hypothetical protein n=1 Tax=Burkholderia vietnamiensis TaxID=60552 RepID=UPI0007589EC1|nr:hypothetical protein [Burkholderia vietnamiensis]KVF25204.1 hypothetical protein WJ07_12260 [Burkholderia vietnamiensis]